MNKAIINYIKLRENWKDWERAKSGASSEIISGIWNFGTFLAYWCVEKYLLDYDKLYREIPNFKYVFYLSLAFGIWGLIGCLWGAINYFNAKSKAEQLKRQVEQLEKELIFKFG